MPETQLKICRNAKEKQKEHISPSLLRFLYWKNIIKTEKRRNYNEKIEVYTQPDCPPCVIVKEFLKHNNVAYEEFDVQKTLLLAIVFYTTMILIQLQQS